MVSELTVSKQEICDLVVSVSYRLNELQRRQMPQTADMIREHYSEINRLTILQTKLESKL